jgi:CRISPR-associated exonuclease Cas4
MYDEDDLLPLSAMQHLAFCERQCALIHLEGLWADNRLTVEGAQFHKRVHYGRDESRGGVRIARGVRLRSLRLGLAGVADVVEFHRVDGGGDAMVMPGRRGRWRPVPIEYKRGRAKPDSCDKVQLCAQAICLEEMLGVTVPAGAIFYGRTRSRLKVDLEASLRRATERTAVRLHELLRSGRTPPAERKRECRSCSMLDLCMPRTKARPRSARRYIEGVIKEILADLPGA